MRQNSHGFVTKWLILQGSGCDHKEITATKWRLSQCRGAAARRSRGGAESAVSRRLGEGAGGRVRQGAGSQPNQGRAKSGVCGFLVARAGQCSERGGGNIKAEHLGDRQQAAAAAHKGERSARRRHWLCVIQPEPPTEHRRRLRRRR